MSHISRGGSRRIEPSRRLVSEGLCAATGIREFYDESIESRVIYVPDKVCDAMCHLSLLEAGVSLLPAQLTDRGINLVVPAGSQTLRQILKSIANDTIRYAPLFTQIGKQLYALGNYNYGLESTMLGRTVLGGIGFSPVKNDSFKNSLFFLPPYVFKSGISIDKSISNVNDELLSSKFFTDADILRLDSAIHRGINKRRKHKSI